MRRIALSVLVTCSLLPAVAAARTSVSPCLLREPPADPGVLLAEATSRFKASHKRRATNVRLAASRLDGQIIPPRGRLSYNRVVGPRTAESGYRKAPVILQGRYQNRAGGGVCQPSSTLYSAAMLAGFRVPDRSPHLWVAGYVGPGFDATVSWRTKDLVIENPYAFPVTVQAHAGVDYLTIRLLGERAPPHYVVMKVTTLETSTFPVKRERHANVPPGTEVVAVPGELGMKVSRVRERWRAGRRVGRETLTTDAYAPRPMLILEPPETITAAAQ